DDLEMIHEKRIPLFSLSEAASRPTLYRGRLVLIRARAVEVGAGVGKSMRLGGTTVGNTGEERRGSSPYLGSDEIRISRNSISRSTSASQLHVGDNVPTNVDIETGMEAVARFDNPDPFMKPEDAYVFLARFDRMTRVPGAPGEEAQT